MFVRLELGAFLFGDVSIGGREKEVESESRRKLGGR